MKITTIEEFYKQASVFIPPGISKEIGHFNVFDMEELMEKAKKKPTMPYNRRAYYKISMIIGRNRAEYADKVIEIEKNALLFATPKVPYHYLPYDLDQSGYFCIFTDEFLAQSKSGVVLDDLPIFRPGGYPIFQVTEEEQQEIIAIFRKMQKELSSDYAYKYDLLRNYVVELIHFGQKLQPATSLYPTSATISKNIQTAPPSLIEKPPTELRNEPIGPMSSQNPTIHRHCFTVHHSLLIINVKKTLNECKSTVKPF